MRKNTVQPGRTQVTIQYMPIACWIPKSTNTYSEYVILIAFHCNNVCTNVRQFYLIRKLPVLLIVRMVYNDHINNQRGAAFYSLYLMTILYMFRASFAHHQEFRTTIAHQSRTHKTLHRYST